MDDIPDFDLLDLQDSFFDVHDIVLKDENELFTLPSNVELVVKSNPKAQFDGVFRVSIAIIHPAYRFPLLKERVLFTINHNFINFYAFLSHFKG